MWKEGRVKVMNRDRNYTVDTPCCTRTRTVLPQNDSRYSLVVGCEEHASWAQPVDIMGSQGDLDGGQVGQGSTGCGGLF
jgi:hypothetical protein